VLSFCTWSKLASHESPQQQRQDILALDPPRQLHFDVGIKTARPQERGIDEVYPVCQANHKDIFHLISWYIIAD
jgi:hypothetical protein